MEISLGELAVLLNGQLVGDPHVTVTQLCSMSQAESGDITFLSDKKFRENLAGCKASVILIKAADQELCQTNVILVDDPYLAYAKTAQALDTTPEPAYEIAPTAVIDETVKLGAGVRIGANSVIESGVELADDVVIGPGCFIGKNTVLGQGTKLWANVTLYHGVTIGEKCLLQSGAVIGSDGFGYANENGRWQKIPQLGGVRIGDRVEIGACTTVDRGAINDTVIENDVILDNQIQVAHNVHIGTGTAMAGGTIIAGSVRIGKNCMIGGASVINGHIEIADGCHIAGMSVIAHTIKTKGSFAGYPAQDRKKALKNMMLMTQLDEMSKRIKVLEKQL